MSAGRRRSPALAALAVLLVGLAVAPGCGDDAHHERGLFILGIDGMDPILLREFIAQGRTPNLARLAEQGGFVELGTANPPQSPVAWSEFITGHGSDVHGIYDFLHRDPETVAPYLSTSRADPPTRTLDAGEWTVPVAGGGIVNLREGEAFWRPLAEADVPVTVLKIPAEYPPKPCERARVISGMGTPDLLGTPGIFQLFTDDMALVGRDPAGGRIHPVDFAGGQAVTTVLQGPPHPLRSTGEILELPLLFAHDADAGTAFVRLGETERILKVGEWTGWIPIDFPLGAGLPSVRGMVRLWLGSVSPRRTLYVSPINFDPFDPAQPISTPPEFAAELAERVGRFHTQGMPEDTKALQADVLPPEAFLEQSGTVFAERLAMLEVTLDDWHGGFGFVYFSSVDLVCHMFYRSLDPEAPDADRRFAQTIPELYERVDRVVGLAMDELPDDTTLMVMSDHGFAHWRTQAHLNTWLVRNGYMALQPGRSTSGKLFESVDWSGTQAYALGLNQVFLNLQGRESRGIVAPEEAEALLRRLSADLEAWTDPDGAEPVVSSVARPEKHPDPNRSPDLLVGYHRGYRSSDGSALGEVSELLLEPNTGRWSGDHCMDPAVVPGVLLSSQPVIAGGALRDMAPTILDYFDVEPSAPLPGRSLLANSGD
jgi:predicted AlkP superfamily phosphohydrolase/phosphomutase